MEKAYALLFDESGTLLQCIKDGPFKLKTAEGADKPESQCTPNERRVVNQDQRLKIIIISCLPDDIMKSVISCETAKDTWTDLVNGFEGPYDTKENKIMDMKLQYQNFKAKTSESLSQTYTRYKTLLNELANNGVTLSKHEINDFQENSDDEVDERTSEEYLRVLDIEFHERGLLENSKLGKNHALHGEWIDITMKKCRDDLLALKQAKLEAFTFQIQNTELIKLNHALQDQLKEERNVNENWLNSSNKVSQCISEQIPNQQNKILDGEQLTESSSKNDAKGNPFFPASLNYDHEVVPKSKDWVERLNSDNKLPNFNTGRILVHKSKAINECLQLTKGSSPRSESNDFGPTKITLSRRDLVLGNNENITKAMKTQESLNKNVSRLVTISNPELVTSSVPTKVKTNDQESKIIELTKQPESSKSVNSSKQIQDSKSNGKNHDSSKPVRLKPLQKPKLKCELCDYTNNSTDDCYRILYCMKCKREDHRTSDHDMYIASLRSSQIYKAQPYQYASPSKQILKSKAKPFPPCTHYGFNDHRHHDCRNYPECEICRSYDHFTLENNHVIQIRGGVLVESFQSSESSLCELYYL
ncbi:hypothetical protein Tco_1396699 [Tanacetum coccineum]